jgi:DNA-binding GntR family transcriptional regulator
MLLTRPDWRRMARNMSQPKATEDFGSSIISLERASSLKEQAYRQIKTLLLTGKLSHGTVASVPLIAKRLGISRTPVREAFLDLEKDGLITILPKKGAVTNPISSEKKREIFLIRNALEGIVVRKLADSITETQILTLKSIFERHRKTPQGEAGWDEFIRVDREFHLTMASFAGFGKIRAILDNIRDLIELIGREALSSHGRREKIFREHKRILQALERKNQSAAAQALRFHLRETERSLKG